MYFNVTNGSYLFIYLFTGRESNRTYMTDGVKKKCEINAKLREYTFYINGKCHNLCVLDMTFERFLFTGRCYTPAYKTSKKKRKESTGDYYIH